jgi:Phage capsid protein
VAGTRENNRPDACLGFREFLTTKIMPFLNSTIPDGFQLQYTDEWDIALSQRASRLQAYIDVVPISGESQRFQRIAPAVSRRITDRFGASNPDDVNAEYRWLDVHSDKAVNRISYLDGMLLGTTGSPHNAILKAHAEEAGRQMDATIVQGCIGPVRAGKTGGVTVDLPGNQKLPVNFVDSGAPVNSGMTFAKLLEVATLFGVNQVTGQELRTIRKHASSSLIVRRRT